jgi:hypothetical protein
MKDSMEQRINEVLIKGKRSDKLAVFDLDDCLIISTAKIQVIDPETHKVIKTLTPAEFNFFTPNKKVNLSFKEFEDYDILKKSHFIQEVLQKLLNYYKSGVHVSIVTARSDSKMIGRFFHENGIDIHPELIFAINDPSLPFKGSIAEKKKQALQTLVQQGYTDFIFFDDNEDNLRLAKEIEKEEDVVVKTVKV